MHYETLARRRPELESLLPTIKLAGSMIVDAYRNGGKVLICGNGGSAADSEHIVGELMKGFLLKRPLNQAHTDLLTQKFPQDAAYLVANLQEPLTAISLVSHTSLMTAYMNDVAPDMVFAQQVLGYGKPGDILIGISTSGNSANIINAIKVASALELKTIGMTNQLGGEMKTLCDILINPPAAETYITQEYHLSIYHTLCMAVEASLFTE